MAKYPRDPFILLHRMEQESRATVPGLPQHSEAAAVWAGLGFKVGDLRLLVPLDQVREVVPYAGVTPVPGTKRWLKGVSNVRGDLLTVVDLAGFLGKEPVIIDANCRLLILNAPGLHSAVLVTEVLGLKHFFEEQERREIPDIEAPVRGYLKGAFSQKDGQWMLFDMHLLVQSEVFRHVAA